ncbi:MAG: hypothetical protein P8184_18745 [Calditrichia bacterium]
MKKRLLIIPLLLICLSQLGALQPEKKSPLEKNAVMLPASFPAEDYTPFGYIDNPYHSYILNRSGLIRSVPPLGFGFWKRAFKGSYKDGPQGYVNYLSHLYMSVSIDGVPFVESEDFAKNKVSLSSRYHTKHLMSYDWNYKGIDLSLKYFLPDENVLACLVELKNSSRRNRKIILNATNIYGLWDNIWWGSNGLSGNYNADTDAVINKIWAYGDVYALASDFTSTAHKITGSEEEWKRWQFSGDSTSTGNLTVKGTGPIYSMQSYRFSMAPDTRRVGVIYLCRGRNEKWVLDGLENAKKETLPRLTEQLQDDQKFWSKAPVLEGDWPAEWRHGWVYDWETLRMNVRRPIGIFHHPWDAMLVHAPRVVLGETALDMTAMSYADPELAKEVIYGTFADAVMPNIPCVREDGSMNMIGADGSECGTAPMWGFPFHAINSIYSATQDSVWLRKLYPHLKAYIEWWLKNRTDNEGWLHCNNSWESGQDGSRRFLVKSEGDPATFVRTVDVEASMAEAMLLMEKFARITGHTQDLGYWKDLSAQRIRNTRSMFAEGWFRDVDGRNNQPIIFNDYSDVMLMTPVTCGIASQQQVDIIRPKLRNFIENQRWLQWPPALMTFTEAAWRADEPLLAAQAVYNVASRVYNRTDSRQLLFVDKDEPYSYRIPGVANEFWPYDFRPPGAENYGWGATLPSYIIRDIIGYKESSSEEKGFCLVPAMPEVFTEKDKSYGITNLKYCGLRFDVIYRMKTGSRMQAELTIRNRAVLDVEIWKGGKKVPVRMKKRNGDSIILFEAENGGRYLVKLI